MPLRLKVIVLETAFGRHTSTNCNFQNILKCGKCANFEFMYVVTQRACSACREKDSLIKHRFAHTGHIFNILISYIDAMSLKAAFSTGVLPRLPVHVQNVRAFQPANLRTSIITHAKIEEINTDDTPGVDTLLDRDYK